VAELNDTLFDRGITVRTFPQVFLDDEHIGGYTELYARVAMTNYDFEIDNNCF
jgi:glutaredoxin